MMHFVSITESKIQYNYSVLNKRSVKNPVCKFINTIYRNL